MAIGFDPVGFGTVGFPGQGAPAAGSGVQPAWFDDDDDLVVGLMIKNTASQKVGVQMVAAADGSAFTGSVTVAVTVDAGTQATGSVGSGACAHEGNGYHTYAPAQAETNGDLVAFTFTGSGAIPKTVQVYTRAGDAFTRLGAPAGASVSADIAAAFARMGAPAGASLAADIASAYARIGAPAGASIAADLVTIAGYIDTEIAALVSMATAIKAVTDALPEGFKKNTAFSNFVFFMADSTDHVTGKTALTVTAQRSIDGGAFAACTNAVAEIANGWYKINLSAADLNGDSIALKFTATGADATGISIKTKA